MCFASTHPSAAAAFQPSAPAAPAVSTIPATIFDIALTDHDGSPLASVPVVLSVTGPEDRVVLGVTDAAGRVRVATLFTRTPRGLHYSSETVRALAAEIVSADAGLRAKWCERIMDLAAEAAQSGDTRIAVELLNSVVDSHPRVALALTILDDRVDRGVSEEEYVLAVDGLLAVPAGKRLSRFSTVFLAFAAESPRRELIAARYTNSARLSGSSCTKSRLIFALQRRLPVERLRERVTQCSPRDALAALAFARPETWSDAFGQSVLVAYEGVDTPATDLSAQEVAGAALLFVLDATLRPLPPEAKPLEPTQLRGNGAADAVVHKIKWLALGLDPQRSAQIEQACDALPNEQERWGGSAGLYRSRVMERIIGDLSSGRLEGGAKFSGSPSDFSALVLGIDRDRAALDGFLRLKLANEWQTSRALRMGHSWAFAQNPGAAAALQRLEERFYQGVDPVVVGLLASNSLNDKLNEYRVLVGNDRYIDALLLALRRELSRSIMQWPEVLWE